MGSDSGRPREIEGRIEERASMAREGGEATERGRDESGRMP